MTDLPGYGGAIYCGECYSTNHTVQQCPYVGEDDE